MSRVFFVRNFIHLSCLGVFLFVEQLAAAGQHEFRFAKPGTQSVSLMGEFNGWKGQPMIRQSNGSWSATVSLPPGRHAYKFFVNGTDWVLDPANSNRKAVDGVENSAVDIKEGDSPTPRSSPAPSPLLVSAKSGGGASERGRLDFNALAERKRFDFNRTGNQHTVTTKETWGYKVTLENKSFAPAAGLEVQYRQFKFDDAIRGSTKLIAVPGSAPIPTLATGQKTTFETTPVEIEKLELRPGWFYTDEAKEKVKDRLAGVWLRILSGDDIIFEWQSPPDLKSRATWD